MDNTPASAPSGEFRKEAPGIGVEIRRSVFRDTRTYYADAKTGQAAPQLLRFARRHAGPRILDLGCATGHYVSALSALGFRAIGADTNSEYVRIALANGVDARLVTPGGKLPFQDHEFDTVLLFEVLEHCADPGALLVEARRVACRNVLVTVPNCEETDAMRPLGLLFEHFADLDHRNFFTSESLSGLLGLYFRDLEIARGDPLGPIGLTASPLLDAVSRLALRLRLMRPRFYFRLYAVARP